MSRLGERLFVFGHWLLPEANRPSVIGYRLLPEAALAFGHWLSAIYCLHARAVSRREPVTCVWLDPTQSAKVAAHFL